MPIARELDFDATFGVGGKLRVQDDDAVFTTVAAFTVRDEHLVFAGSRGLVFGAKLPYQQSRLAVVSEDGELRHLETPGTNGTIVDVTFLANGGLRAAIGWDLVSSRSMRILGLGQDGVTDAGFGMSGTSNVVFPGIGSTEADWSLATASARVGDALFVGGGAGPASTASTGFTFAVARLDDKGVAEAVVKLPVPGTIRRLIALPEGKLLALGVAPDQSRFYGARFTTALTLDAAFGNGGVVEIPLLSSSRSARVGGIVRAGDGALVLALNEMNATADPSGDLADVALARLDEAGRLTAHRLILRDARPARDVAVYRSGTLLTQDGFTIVDVKDDGTITPREPAFPGGVPARMVSDETTVTVGGLVEGHPAAIRLVLP